MRARGRGRGGRGRSPRCPTRRWTCRRRRRSRSGGGGGGNGAAKGGGGWRRRRRWRPRPEQPAPAPAPRGAGVADPVAPAEQAAGAPAGGGAEANAQAALDNPNLDAPAGGARGPRGGRRRPAARGHPAESLRAPQDRPQRHQDGPLPVHLGRLGLQPLRRPRASTSPPSTASRSARATPRRARPRGRHRGARRASAPHRGRLALVDRHARLLHGRRPSGPRPRGLRRRRPGRGGGAGAARARARRRAARRRARGGRRRGRPGAAARREGSGLFAAVAGRGRAGGQARARRAARGSSPRSRAKEEQPRAGAGRRAGAAAAGGRRDGRRVPGRRRGPAGHRRLDGRRGEGARDPAGAAGDGRRSSSPACATSNFGDADSLGFFQMRVSIWNQGEYAGYADDPREADRLVPRPGGGGQGAAHLPRPERGRPEPVRRVDRRRGAPRRAVPRPLPAAAGRGARACCAVRPGAGRRGRGGRGRGAGRRSAGRCGGGGRARAGRGAPIDPGAVRGRGDGRRPPDAAAQALLENKRVILDSVGVADVKAGRIDPRIVAVLTTLSKEHTITVSCMCSDHSKFTVGGSVSNHHFGRGLDIAAIDGRPVNASNFDAREIALELQELAPSIRPDEIGSPFADRRPGLLHRLRAPGPPPRRLQAAHHARLQARRPTSPRRRPAANAVGAAVAEAPRREGSGLFAAIAQPRRRAGGRGRRRRQGGRRRLRAVQGDRRARAGAARRGGRRRGARGGLAGRRLPRHAVARPPARPPDALAPPRLAQRRRPAGPRGARRGAQVHGHAVPLGRLDAGDGVRLLRARAVGVRAGRR